MMLGWGADLCLVAKHLFGQRGLADSRKLHRALNIRILIDLRITTAEWVIRKLCGHSQRLARKESVEALGAFRGARGGPQQWLDGFGSAAHLLGASSPIKSAGPQFALLGKGCDLMK